MAALAELELMRTTPKENGQTEASVLMGTSALSDHLALQRKEAARTTSPTVPSIEAAASSPLSPSSSAPLKKRRAPTIGGRAKPKKVRKI